MRSNDLMTSSNENIIRVWIPLTKDSEAWCFLWSVPEQTFEETIETPVIWYPTTLIMTLL